MRDIGSPVGLALYAHAWLRGLKEIVGGGDSLARCASLWAGQADPVCVFLTASHAPVGDVSTAGIVVIGVDAHCKGMSIR